MCSRFWITWVIGFPPEKNDSLPCPPNKKIWIFPIISVSVNRFFSSSISLAQTSSVKISLFTCSFLTSNLLFWMASFVNWDKTEEAFRTFLHLHQVKCVSQIASIPPTRKSTNSNVPLKWQRSQKELWHEHPKKYLFRHQLKRCLHRHLLIYRCDSSFPVERKTKPALGD